MKNKLPTASFQACQHQVTAIALFRTTPPSNLTPAEHMILAHLAQGKPPKEISEECGVRWDVVRSRIQNILHKTGTPNAVALSARYAIRNPQHNAQRAELSPRLQVVAGHVAKGLTDKEIATLLNMAPSTVKKDVVRIKKSTGIPRRSGLAQLGIP